MTQKICNGNDMIWRALIYIYLGFVSNKFDVNHLFLKNPKILGPLITIILLKLF